jgi:demethylmenaquinone methyltransferase / 2-methoxy-6-polyprenyl-1,4-benzoquinol methylase
VIGDIAATLDDKDATTIDINTEIDDISDAINDKSATTDDKDNMIDNKGDETSNKDDETDDKDNMIDNKGDETSNKDDETDDKDNMIDNKGDETGDKNIAKENKDHPLKEFYKKIYGRYDLVNRIFTFGQDRNWRKKAVEECLGNAPRQVLDVCTGTGDLVLELAQTAGQTEDSTEAVTANEAAQGKDLSDKGLSEKDALEEGSLKKGLSEKDAQAKAPLAADTSTPINFIGYDFSPEMLEEARKKSAKAGQKIEFIEGNVAEMPFADNRFDTAGITFGIRNLIYENSNAEKHLAEIHRVLRGNGRLVVLESSRPDSRVWRFFNGIYLQFILPWLGGLISGNLKAYRYLAKSSQNYYSRKEMAAILEKAGFRVIRSRPLFLGSVMLLVAEKLEK